MEESIKTLIIQYITGETDEDASLEVEQWINASEENRHYFLSMKETWQDTLHYPPNPVIRTDAAFDRLKERLQIPPHEQRGQGEQRDHGDQRADREQRNQPEPQHPYESILRPFSLGKAAAIAGIILVTSGLGLYLTLRPQPQQQQAALDISVPNGRMKKVVLPDSTVVWLNAGTRFGYGPDYGVGRREVALEGQAYFEVMHNAKVPFIVRTSRYTVTDIGTIFTVSAYPGDKNFETAVVEGKVEVAPTQDGKMPKVLLAKNQVLKIGQPATSKITAAKTVPTPVQPMIQDVPELAPYAGWKDQLLVFDEETFDEVARRLERTFNVPIRISSDELAKLRYTGRFNRVSGVDDALKIIQETTAISYRYEKDTIVISKRP